MPAADFHDKPFDEGTLTKLQIFELYSREWLPVFLSRKDVWYNEVHVYDFFAGPGTDVEGTEGSPLRLLRKLQEAQRDRKRFPGWDHVRVHAHLFDAKAKNVDKLRQAAIPLGREIPGLQVEVERLDFLDALSRSQAVLENRRAAKLLLIDQFGVDSVTADVFRTLVKAPTCDFLFFLSSATLSRFRDHPAIKQKIVRPADPYHVHRAALDYYRGLLDPEVEYYLAPFSIKKKNIYGLIFGSAHARGMDKFLQVAWKEDEVNGEANFDIERDNLRPDQPTLFAPTKLTAFERDLERELRSGGVVDEADVVSICFRHGVLRSHAKSVLTQLKRQGVIDLDFSVPDIKNLRDPRPIRLLR